MEPSPQRRWRRVALLVLGALLISASVVTTWIVTSRSTRRDAAGVGSPEQGTVPADALADKRSDHDRNRGPWTGRVAAGDVPERGVDRSWGFVVVDGIRGHPEPGDEAYLARLGPQGGLLRVESVEDDRAVMSFHTVDPGEIRDGDRIETMPPANRPNKSE